MRRKNIHFFIVHVQKWENYLIQNWRDHNKWKMWWKTEDDLKWTEIEDGSLVVMMTALFFIAALHFSSWSSPIAMMTISHLNFPTPLEKEEN